MTQKIKGSQLPTASNIDGFYAFGIELSTNRTVKVPISLLRGNNGKDFKFLDFTPEQLELLKGASFEFEDLTKGQKAELVQPAIDYVENLELLEVQEYSSVNYKEI